MWRSEQYIILSVRSYLEGGLKGARLAGLTWQGRDNFFVLLILLLLGVSILGTLAITLPCGSRQIRMKCHKELCYVTKSRG